MTTWQIVLCFLSAPLVGSALALLVFGGRAVLKAREPLKEDLDFPPCVLIRSAYERSEIGGPQ